jgi:hypothetical protein
MSMILPTEKADSATFLSKNNVFMDAPKVAPMGGKQANLDIMKYMSEICSRHATVGTEQNQNASDCYKETKPVQD